MSKHLIFAFLILGACTKKPAGSSASSSAEELVQRGRAVYVSSCIACHNIDPAKDGALGPALKGSSLELLQLRVLKAQYPAGYTPKRATGQMPALPHLEKEIPALHAFLNQ